MEPITSGEDYSEILENDEDELLPLYKFLAYVVRSDWDIFDKYKDTVIEEFIDDMDVPDVDSEE